MCPVSLGFRTPLNPTIIWRYMPLSKFATFVQSSALWFAAVSSFPDRFEGTKAAAEASARDRLWDRLGVSEEQRETIPGLTDWNRQFSFVNCWMLNTKESDLVWFFFSSRRRHTRSLCDWSSDVCSSACICRTPDLR